LTRCFLGGLIFFCFVAAVGDFILRELDGVFTAVFVPDVLDFHVLDEIFLDVRVLHGAK
jgi:hypothetical protein